VSLGRDLSVSVLDAIERARPNLESATVLAMPQVEAERQAARGRGLVWAAIAVAAALLLMALRPADEQRRDREVAQGVPERRLEAVGPTSEFEASVPADDLAKMSRSAAPPASTAARPAADRAGAAGGRSQPGGELRSMGAVTQDSAQAVPPPPGAAAAPAGTASTPMAADRSGAAISDLAVVEVPVAGEDAAAEFSRLLAANGVTISDEPLSADFVDGLDERLSEELRDSGDVSDAPADAEGYLVEGSPAQVRAVIDAVSAAFADVTFRQQAQRFGNEASSERGGGAAGFGGFGGGGAGGRTLARAWRVPQARKLAEAAEGESVDAASMRGITPPAEDKAENDAAPAARRARTRESAQAPARALFLLRRGGAVQPATER
jgi:hypothetical protein